MRASAARNTCFLARHLPGRRVGAAFLLQAGLALPLLASCKSSETSPTRAPAEELWKWELPAYLDEPKVPASNPLTKIKVELGRRLFFDKRLSGNQTQACSSCHVRALGFAHPGEKPEGSTGKELARNAQSLANVAWFSSYTWANPRLTTLETQGLVPLVGDTPPELHAGSDLPRILADLRADPFYKHAFERAFPARKEPFSIGTILDALASYQRTLISLNAPYDRWLAGDSSALSASARRGLGLFESKRLRCSECHGGPLQTNAAFTGQREKVFFNTGLYERYPADAPGLFEMTTKPEDFGRFRVPSLRNVTASRPYFHDGSAEQLEDVIDHYQRGGRLVEAGPFAGDGKKNPYKSPKITGFTLSAAERSDLLAFLAALTDKEFLSAPTP